MLRAIPFTLALFVAQIGLAQTNPVALWLFDEASGVTALDSSSNNHTCAIVAGTSVSGRTSAALFFTGTNSYAFASDITDGGTASAGLDTGTRDWTAAAWIKTTNSGMVLTKMGFVGGSNPDGWGLSVSGNGTVGAVLHKSGVGTVNIFAGDGQVVNDGQWHHIAAVFNRVGNLVRYANGIATGTPSALNSLSGQSIDNTNQVRMAARDQAGDEVYFRGAIDDTRVYARALTSDEIATLAGITPPPPPPQPVWSSPMTLVGAYPRIALGNRVHVTGHTSGNLVYRNSQDNGATWSSPAIVAPGSSNYPMQYGGLYSVSDTVYLLTAAGDMGAFSQPLDFRKSTNNGATWSSPVRITRTGQEIRRAIIIARDETVHVFGGQSDANGYGTGVFYFRSTNGGATWDAGVKLYDQADASARMAVDGTSVHIAFGAKLTTNSFGGRTTYMRSTDNGTTWGPPSFIGENTSESDVQARQQIAAADGRVFSMWQRERPSLGGALPALRLGYNRSTEGGSTWLGLQVLPGDQILSTDTNIVRDHHQIWMSPGGGLHIVWAHGQPGDPSTPLGYIYSPDYGTTWTAPEIAGTSYGGGVPDGIVADDNWVHIMAEPGAYARRRLPPVFRSVRAQCQSLILEWAGSAMLQLSTLPNGPWTNIPSATAPFTNTIAAPSQFYRLRSL